MSFQKLNGSQFSLKPYCKFCKQQIATVLRLNFAKNAIFEIICLENIKKRQIICLENYKK